MDVAAEEGGDHVLDLVAVGIGDDWGIAYAGDAQGLDQGGNAQTGIGLDVNAITQANGKSRLGNAVGGDGSVSSLVLEPNK